MRAGWRVRRNVLRQVEMAMGTSRSPYEGGPGRPEHSANGKEAENDTSAEESKTAPDKAAVCTGSGRHAWSGGNRTASAHGVEKKSTKTIAHRKTEACIRATHIPVRVRTSAREQEQKVKNQELRGGSW